MRIKCPNSDIVLELPGDKTDMKFTCPACHKVHRVTVKITTPGEEPPPPPSPPRSVTRTQPQLPKKYATGAYPPVVDIPIDANFILLDGSTPSQQGIDLGAAADPAGRPMVDRDLSNRHTEILRNKPDDTPPPKEDKPKNGDGESWSERVGPKPEPVDDRPEGRRLWDEVSEPAKTPAAPAGSSEPPPASDDETVTEEEDAPGGPRTERSGRGHSSASAPKKKSRTLLWLLILLLLAGGGFLGWQEYLRRGNMESMNNSLAWADSSWERGDIPAAGDFAREAAAALGRDASFTTPESLYNRAAGLTGWFQPRQTGNPGAEKRIRTHLDREAALATFRNEIDPAHPEALAEALREATLGAELAGDKPLSAAVRKAAADAALAELAAAAPDAAPEVNDRAAERLRLAVGPLLEGPPAAEFAAGLDAFRTGQAKRLLDDATAEASDLASAASSGDDSALDGYQALASRLASLPPGFAKRAPGLEKTPAGLAAAADAPTLRQLDRLSGIIDRGTGLARSVLGREAPDEQALEAIAREAADDATPNPAMASAAAKRVRAAMNDADELVNLRAELYERLQSEMRRNRSNSGTRLAWSMLRAAFGDPEAQVNPAGFKWDADSARMELVIRGVPAVVDMRGDDFENVIRARVGGYDFTAGWSLLFHKPLVWMADLAGDMRRAGVDPVEHPAWETLEGPGGLLALSRPAETASEAALPSPASRTRRVFFNGKLHAVRELPVPEGSALLVENFRAAAVRLHDTVMATDSIAQTLRQALKPILMGTYQQPDPRDFFDSSFCRRLVEADYLETYINPMPAGIRRDLEAYRAALAKLEDGYDEFEVDLGDGRRLAAVVRLDADLSGEGRRSDQDPETGERVQRYTWRVEEPSGTTFFSPLPSRFIYAFMLAERYDGRHRTRPRGAPALTEVWHATHGMLASYKPGDDRATGDGDLWDKAIEDDLSGRFDPTMGPPGWNFPLHVLSRDDQGDPLTLATLSGTVESPDFSGIADPVRRRKAEDAWLDSTAKTLETPGELGLIFHHFFRYCSDSPMSELPNLIGSHYGLSDTHQTVYESLERRWVGRLIGDCDDLAEFFQVLTRRQGKLSHVMQLPGHAACGYVEKAEEADVYRFIVLQTGPVLQFTAPSLNDVVEFAYRSFDRDGGMSHMTTDAVPLLLRFADEETRTPFVLSARIYGDAGYAEDMIRVQAYWHEHVYSAAVEVMEEMVGTDKEIGNIKELGSLYERVGMYAKSAEMRYAELDMVRDNPAAAISTLVEIVQLHFQEKDREKALAALGEIEAIMQDMIRRNDAPAFFNAMSFRSLWAMYLSRLDQPARAWTLVRHDAVATKSQLGRVADQVLRVLVVLYDRLAMKKSGKTPLTREEERALSEMRREIEDAFAKGYFKADDAYSATITRYFVLGRFAVSDVGREKGLARLKENGPYAHKAKDHTKRGRGVGDEDWEWLRITPPLYLAFGLEMLDREEYPEFYDPAGAKPLLENVQRAVDRGAGLGSDVAGGDDVVKAKLALSFLDRDLAAFRRQMAEVKRKDYSSLYDDAALTFGLHCGLIPLSEFQAWIDVFREFFPGTQHYFKVVYRAIDKEHYDHALMMAEATARFFPDRELLVREAAFIRGRVPVLKEQKVERDVREMKKGAAEAITLERKPAA